MRWSIIRLIWLRELRDQLRDRRTVFMIAVLPVLLYPVVGFGFLSVIQATRGPSTRVGILGSEHLVPWDSSSPLPSLVWLTVTPPLPGQPLAGVASMASATAFATADPRREYPPLLVPAGQVENTSLVFNPAYRDPEGEDATRALVIRKLGPQLTGPASATPADAKVFAESIDSSPLDQRAVDLLLIVPPGFQEALHAEDRPYLFILTRETDDSSRRVNVRVTGILNHWQKDLKAVRLVRHGLAPDFDEPFQKYDPARGKSLALQDGEGLANLLVRAFPVILVLWSVTGALYPAIDLCAGEKERGTMETLLISPAGREEIVLGKFLTIWVFSAGTALLNLLSMGISMLPLHEALPGAAFQWGVAFWGVLLLLPLSAFFSALCLAVGAYARSSKEGQYYLMPLFLFTLPLGFLTLIPGIDLNPFYSLVPVTGVALLLQKLVKAGTPNWGLGLYFVPVLAPMVVYSWLALRWAIAQFQREEVLFREAERLDIGLWLRRLLREKEMLPSAGEAGFCFALILALRWLSFNVGTHLPLLARTGISHLAFVAAPPLFMAVVLTTRPRLGLALRLPPWWAWPAAILLALLVVPPLAELTLAILDCFRDLRAQLELHQALPGELRTHKQPADIARYFVVLAVLPALCEEIAFRGFILTGLLRSCKPWSAVLLSSFLFALYPMNVFQLVPHFVFGVVLGLLVVRSGSVLPAMVFHLVYNTVVIAPALLPGLFEGLGLEQGGMPVRVALAVGCAVLAGLVLAAIWRFGGVRARGVPSS
jgi:sodium transport system permease protein